MCGSDSQLAPCSSILPQSTDTRGRIINYLRLSVTDRCNLRCCYCMPQQGIPHTGAEQILSYGELYRIARSAVSFGIEKIRITGGEPLLRRDIIPFLQQISTIPGLKKLVLTTNGMLLEELAADLRDAGVQRLNVSLDSLNEDTFAKITRCGSLERVLRGIEKAKRSGLPLKLNMVVMRGINDHEVADFARLAAETSSTVRFIEYMPAIRDKKWQELVVPGKEILSQIERQFALQPLRESRVAGPANNFRLLGTEGTIGLITSISEHFCSHCNRIRVTSTGQAKGCLFSDVSFDLKPALQTADDRMLADALRAIVAAKPAGHLMNSAECHHQAFSMASIGG